MLIQVIIEHVDMNNKKVDREFIKGTFILFIKKLCHISSVATGKWIAKKMHTDASKILGIEPHEFLQMLNTNMCYVKTYWAYF